jgi:pimeloyl-ACP methyl ester carboxylesterase
VLLDALESNPAVKDIPLSEITVPTLIVHARDDAGPPYKGAVAMAHQIRGARLLTIERGGHLMLGDHAWAADEVAGFLSSLTGRRAPPAPRGNRRSERRR